MSKLVNYFLQKFSLHDGKGIRSTLFLKGCTIHCQWCHNPESIQTQPQLSFSSSDCLLDCNICVETCKENAITKNLGNLNVDRVKCTECFDCTDVCPSTALKKIGKESSIEEIYEELMRDNEFYKATDGGVTISGGEPLLQSKALVDLLKLLKKDNVHVLIETSCNVPFDNIEEVNDYVDEFYVDIKGWKDNHKELTGVRQDVILSNIVKMLRHKQMKKKITFRYPVVPGLNDDMDSITKVCFFLKSYGVNRISLLKYHNMYNSKLNSLIETKQNVLDVKPSDESIERVGEQFEKNGIRVKYPVEFKQEEIQKNLLPERVWRLKESIHDAKLELCVERPVLLTKYYKNKKNQRKDPLIQRAEVLSYILKNQTNPIYEDELLVGTFTSKRVSGPIHLELHGIGIFDEVFSIGRRKVNPFKITARNKWKLIKCIPYWLTRNSSALAYGKTKILAKKKQQTDPTEYVIPEAGGFAHFSPDYETLLRKGTKNMSEEAKKLKEESSDEKQKLFYDSIIIACKGMEEYAEEHRLTALSMMLENDLTEERKSDLEKIEAVCGKIPREPCETFHEALQSLLFFHIVLNIEQLDQAICPSRLDYVLYPYYLKSKKDGMTDEEVRELLGCFWIKMNEIVPILNNGTTSYFGGMTTSETISVGGVDEDGNDMTNELTYIMLDVQNCLRMRQPNFYARVHKNSPKEYLDKVSTMLQNGCNTPALANDEVIIPQLMNRGFSLKDARDYILCGCVEPISCGRTYGSTDCALSNIPLCVERMLGLKKGCDMPYTYEDCTNIDELYELFEIQLEYLINKLYEDEQQIEKSIQDYFPTPFASLSLRGCMESGMDASMGGGLYNFTGVQGVGAPDVADSFAAIEEVVFEKELFTLKELVIALKNNFEGTRNQIIQQHLKKAPKYGNDNDKVDKWMIKVLKSFSDQLTCKENQRGGRFTAGQYCITLHKDFGLKTGGLPSGRSAGYPFASGLSVCNGADHHGPTASCNSLTKFDITPFTENGITFNMTLDTSYLGGEIGKNAIKGLFQGYFNSGGMQVQYNVLNPEILIEAKNNPDKYPNLIVRVSGYSAYFKDLDEENQQEIIDRYKGFHNTKMYC